MPLKKKIEMMHARARAIFEEIRSRPYAVSEKLGVSAPNCYFKGTELLWRLGALGYAVRGRVGETYWNEALIPSSIVCLYPRQFLVTHFYVEALIDAEWRLLDTSFDPGLEKLGFRVATWEGSNTPCFEITKLYTQQEQESYEEMWGDPEYATQYFEKAGPFLCALNVWLRTVREDIQSKEN